MVDYGKINTIFGVSVVAQGCFLVYNDLTDK